MMRGLLIIAGTTFLLNLPALAQVPAAKIPTLPKTQEPKPPLLAAWTQFVSDPSRGTEAAKIIQARFVILGRYTDCDGVIGEGEGPGPKTVSATRRGYLQGVDPETSNKFEVTVCTIDLPETWSAVHLTRTGATTLTVYPYDKDATLPGPAALSSQAVLSGIVMADSGCRGKNEGPGRRFYQDCEFDWQFPEVIKAAARDDVGFVMHIGDYHYFFEEERSFWNQDNGRDRFEYWLQEFLVPAQPLLMKAPWVLARGNHESCAELRWFGEGWHVLFSNMSLRGADGSGNRVLRPCHDEDPSGNQWVEPSWAVDFSTKSSPSTPPWRFVVIDSNQPKWARNSFTQAAALTAAHGRDTFWLTHYPPVKMVYYSRTVHYGDREIGRAHV